MFNEIINVDNKFWKQRCGSKTSSEGRYTFERMLASAWISSFGAPFLVYPTKLIKSIAELILKLDPKCWKNVQKLEFSQRYSRTKKQFFVVFVHISHTSITSLYLEDQIDCRINIKTGTEMLKKRSKTWVFSKVPNRQWHFRCGFNRSNFLFCLVRLMTQGYFGSFFFSNINWKNWSLLRTVTYM